MRRAFCFGTPLRYCDLTRRYIALCSPLCRCFWFVASYLLSYSIHSTCRLDYHCLYLAFLQWSSAPTNTAMSTKVKRNSFESVEEKPVHDSSSISTQDKEEHGQPTTTEEGDSANAAEGAPLESAISYQSVPAQPSIPNGGTMAWLQVLAGFCMFFNSWYG